jgi:hypothetical protein
MLVLLCLVQCLAALTGPVWLEADDLQMIPWPLQDVATAMALCQALTCASVLRVHGWEGCVTDKSSRGFRVQADPQFGRPYMAERHAP